MDDDVGWVEKVLGKVEEGAGEEVGAGEHGCVGIDDLRAVRW